MFLMGGCAVIPFQSSENLEPVSAAERDVLAQAARAVEKTPWPKPEPVSLFSRMTGGGDDRFTKADAVDFYLDVLPEGPAGITEVFTELQANIASARELDRAADTAIYSSRPSANDIATVETAIHALLENRKIFNATLQQLAKDQAGDYDTEIENADNEFKTVIQSLGSTADRLAERIEEDRSRAYAKPSGETGNKLNGSGTY